ncbi:MAG TPA: hypothetical protein VMW74_10415 [Nitrosopumilaceae archaeon]|nr:hypothetical protein [Nitrosopumilaceae archaeon]
MTITTSVKIRPDQKDYLEEGAICFSKFVRKKIDEEMKINNYENISTIKCQKQ